MGIPTPTEGFAICMTECSDKVVHELVCWMVGEIQLAQTEERLNYLADIIKHDAADKHPYATGDNLSMLRNFWKRRRDELQRDF